DPEIISRNRVALPLEFNDNFGVVLCGWLRNVQHKAILKQACEPVLIARAFSGLRDSVAIFTQNNHADGHLIGAGKNSSHIGITIGGSRKSVCVNDHDSAKSRLREFRTSISKFRCRFPRTPVLYVSRSAFFHCEAS